MSETAPRGSFYGVMASWFTPSYLFIFINLVIGTIAITSRFTNTTKRHHQLLRSPSLLDRLTSFNFRNNKYDPTTTTTTLTSHNFVVDPMQNPDSPRMVQIRSDFHIAEPQGHDQVNSANSYQLNRVPSSSLLDRIRSFSFHKTENERAEPVQNSDSEMKLVRTPSSLLDRVRSFSLGLKKVENEASESVQQQLSRAPSIIQRLKSLTFDRSESVKESGAESEAELTGEEREEEEGVDAKADDFINKFRQQLRLQRLDSILRYRDTSKRN